MKTILTLISLFLVTVEYSFSATIKVPLQYSTIQAAIYAAQNGDTILVSDGVYEGDINFNGIDFVIVKSESGPENCIIHCGNNMGFVLSGMDNKCVIEGLTIKNATYGIWAYANSIPKIINNVIEGCEGILKAGHFNGH